MCPALGSVFMVLQGRMGQECEAFPKLRECCEPVVPGRGAERRISGASMVREGFLEGVGLEESREKCQGTPARQNRLMEIEPAGLEARTGEIGWGEVEGLVVVSL